MIIFLIFILILFSGISIYFHVTREEKVMIELEKVKNHIQHLQDTLDHYGIRMSNKVPDENKHYKRWYK